LLINPLVASEAINCGRLTAIQHSLRVCSL
jgi:hypothetical protein